MLAGRYRINSLIWLLSIISMLISACSTDFPGGIEAVVATDRLRLRSSTAEAARIVGELKIGDQVTIKEHAEDDGIIWVRVNGPNGANGWTQRKNLIEQDAVNRSRQLAEELKDVPVQANGRSKATLKLRLTPDRSTEKNVLMTLPSGTQFEILRRERRPQPSSQQDKQDQEVEHFSEVKDSKEMKHDEWYQVRLKQNAVIPAGWVYSGVVDLEVPPEIIYYYSTGRKIVGWQKIEMASSIEGNTVNHFLILERLIFGANPEADFDRLKVLAYDEASQDYYTPFREDIVGRFPVRLHVEGISGSLDVEDIEQKTIKYQIDLPTNGKVSVKRLTPIEVAPAAKLRKR